MPLGPVKEKNVSGTVSPQVQSTQVKNVDTYNGCNTTDTVDFHIPLVNRFAALYSDNKPDIFLETMSDDVVIGDHCESISPCSGKALCRNATIMSDVFDKTLVKKRVDQDTIVQAKLCHDYIKCQSQMHRPFGAIPLSPLTTYIGFPTENERNTDPLLVHMLVRASGCPNFLDLRIHVQSNLNIPAWRSYLKNIGINN